MEASMMKYKNSGSRAFKKAIYTIGGKAVYPIGENRGFAFSKSSIFASRQLNFASGKIQLPEKTEKDW
ncbi:hypothetical protein [[Flexibacter] sp. ATCC 35208]|uniref:hypothetical protein n=1 Tax=[Flexibacter] sp. ATCC 35208 TaxID=1936242 RepID=UPI0015C335F0|nr:hypothetical protein [[Flexibacter] sp. ATCC 35208]